MVDVTTFKLEQNVEGEVVTTYKKDEASDEIVAAGVVHKGKLGIKATGGLFVKAGLKGEAVCTVRFASIPLRITGALSMLISPAVALDGELRLDATVTAVTFEAGVAGEIGVETEFGFLYTGATATAPSKFDFINTVTPVFDVDTKYKAPMVTDARFDGNIYVGPVLSLRGQGLNLGFVTLLDVSLIEGRFGLFGKVDLAHTTPQAKDTAYASHYTLNLGGQLSLGDGVKRTLEALGVSDYVGGDSKQELKAAELARSPTGVLATDRTQAGPGGQVKFTAQLDNISIPGFGLNLKGVDIYWFKDGQDPTKLASMEQIASSAFLYVWDVPKDASGDYHFVAFVDTWLAPDIPLEIAPNSQRMVSIGGVCVAWPTGPSNPGDPGDPGNPGDGDNGSCTGGATSSFTSIIREPPGPGIYILESYTTVETSGMEFVYDEEASTSRELELRLVKGTVTVSGRSYEERNGPTNPSICETTYPPTTRALTDSLDDPDNSIGGFVLVYTEATDLWPANSYYGLASAVIEASYTTTCTHDGKSYTSSGTAPQHVVVFFTPKPPYEELPVVQPGGILQGSYTNNDTIFPNEDERVESSSWLFTMPGVGGN